MKNKILVGISTFFGILSIAAVYAQNQTGGTGEGVTNIIWSIIAVVVLLALLPVLRGLILAKRKRQESLAGIKEEIKRLVEGLKEAGMKEKEILEGVKRLAPKAKDLREFLKVVERKNDSGWLAAVRDKLSSLFNGRKIAIRKASFVQRATTQIDAKHAGNKSALFEKVLAQSTMANMLEKEGKDVGTIKEVIKDADMAMKRNDLKTAGFHINTAVELLMKLSKEKK